MNKWFWVILVLAVAALVGVFAIANRNNSTETTNQPDPTVIVEQDHVKGQADSRVVLVEYGDFQCPACAGFYPLLKQAEQEFGDRVSFVFRHFPLSAIHPNAFAASRASEAAGAQGKFWEMHDILYERQSEWAQDSNAQKKFREYAQELGLDSNQFNQDYGSNQTTERINQDINKGKAQEVSATPTFYLNGQKLELGRSYEELKAKLEAALNSPS